MKSNERLTEQLKLQKYLEEHSEKGETVLWQGKPDMKIMFYEEKIDWISPMFIIYLLAVFLSSIISKQSIGFSLIIFSPILLWDFFFEKMKWLYRKKNTMFVITNQRVFELFIIDRYSEEVIIHEKKLDELVTYEVRKFEKGGNLHMGRSRYRTGSSFDYIKDEKYDPNHEDNISFHSFNNYMNHINYFTFFDLVDVDTPAALIRQYTNAVEYIDR